MFCNYPTFCISLLFSFCDWLISLSVMSSSFTHVTICQGFLPFLRLIMYITHFMYPFVCRWTVGCFHLLAIAVLDMGVQISFWDPAAHCFGCTPRSGIAGSFMVIIWRWVLRVPHWSSSCPPPKSLGLCGAVWKPVGQTNHYTLCHFSPFLPRQIFLLNYFLVIPSGSHYSFNKCLSVPAVFMCGQRETDNSNKHKQVNAVMGAVDQAEEQDKRA